MYDQKGGKESMEKEELKVGQKVKAKFRKYGVHSIEGEVTEVCTDEHALQGTWVSIKVTSGNLCDTHVQWLIKNKVGVLVPIKDVTK